MLDVLVGWLLLVIGGCVGSDVASAPRYFLVSMVVLVGVDSHLFRKQFSDHRRENAPASRGAFRLFLEKN